MASTEGECSILRGLLPGATWTARRATGHGILQVDRCPFSITVTDAQLALDFESHSNRALPSKPGHRHARQVLPPTERARLLQEAVDLLRPLLAGGTLLQANFLGLCTSVWGFRSMGCTECPMVVGQLNVQQHMPQL